MPACKFLSMRKATFKSHNQKIYIVNIYLLYVAKKKKKKKIIIFFKYQKIILKCFELY